jgi:hypothetical protein
MRRVRKTLRSIARCECDEFRCVGSARRDSMRGVILVPCTLLVAMSSRVEEVQGQA